MSYLKLAKNWSPQHLFMCLKFLLPIGVYRCFLNILWCKSTLKMWLHCLYVGVLYKVRKERFMWRPHLVCPSVTLHQWPNCLPDFYEIHYRGTLWVVEQVWISWKLGQWHLYFTEGINEFLPIVSIFLDWFSCGSVLKILI